MLQIGSTHLPVKTICVKSSSFEIVERWLKMFDFVAEKIIGGCGGWNWAGLLLNFVTTQLFPCPGKFKFFSNCLFCDLIFRGFVWGPPNSHAFVKYVKVSTLVCIYQFFLPATNYKFWITNVFSPIFRSLGCSKQSLKTAFFESSSRISILWAFFEIILESLTTN